MVKDKYNPVEESHLEERRRFEALSEEEKKVGIDRLHEGALIENTERFTDLVEKITNPEEKEEMELAIKVCKTVKEAGGLALVVGGFARDSALAKFGYNLKPKDIDIEVYGVEQDVLKQALESLGKLEIVGEAFKVFKLKTDKMAKGSMLDISIPRRDSKIGTKHRDFRVEGDPDMLIKEAARRRDFTINALGLDPLTGEILDFYGGIEDIKNKTLRATDEKTFVEDSLRVLRGVQFAARFGFEIDEETKELCRSLDLKELSKERVGDEWLKLLMKAPKPSIGLELVLELGVLDQLHPELKALLGVPQNSEYHPEGDVWTHVKMVLDEAVQVAEEEGLNEEEKKILMLAALCHDLGKPIATKIQEDGKITAYNHEIDGLGPAGKFLDSLSVSKNITDEVLLLVKYHMFIHNNPEPSAKSVRRLARDLHPVTIKTLAQLALADKRGTGNNKSKEYDQAEQILKIAEELSVQESKSQPLIMGRDLLEIGFVPGKKVGQVLKEIEELQLNGKLASTNEAKRYAEVLCFIHNVEQKNIEPIRLLNGEYLSKEDMVDFIKSRFINEKVHDVGTLLMTLILKGDELPKVLAENKEAILTAHKLGPIWFARMERGFYNISWKSFYGLFESANQELTDQLKQEPFEAQTKKGIELILHPDGKLIERYEELSTVKPETHSGKFALYNTDAYPFEAGMFDGYRIMVQYQPTRKRVAISLLNEDPIRVKEIDQKVRELLPAFKNARKIGYLFAQNESGEEDVFNFADAERFYQVLTEELIV